MEVSGFAFGAHAKSGRKLSRLIFIVAHATAILPWVFGFTATPSRAAESITVSAHGKRLDFAPPTVYQKSPEPRSVELRRALTTGSESARPQVEPRRLSREERITLNQELREVLRDAYPPRAGGRP
ncbi:MAG TPA: hypothetical protein VJ673_03665 [Aromatoleum sp.]|uniref:hypothetical protein n=1 Tax=Aromatoleum sp. TaxID=2307007 RepID=UPI002B467A29|nr:hypothetical protein [Aromatoleum sp.]HJV24755.1 hypothetical protein [Aromatoleum sp.]